MLIAVTGSNGFVGKYLCNYLKQIGYKVRPIQRFREKNVFQIKDLKDNNNWARILKGTDIVIHCASKVHSFEKESEESKLSYELINVLATEKIAKEAVKLKIKKFIYISTIKVYGEKTLIGNPFNNDSIVNPMDSYSKSKYRAEEKLRSISSKYGLKVIIVRIPLVYGPFVGANFLSLIKLVKLQIPLPFKNISNKRSIIFVGNLVDFISKCVSNSSANNKSFVVSDSYPVSTRELVILISKSLKKKLFLFKLPIYILKILGKITRNHSKIDRIISNLEVDPKQTFDFFNWKPPYTTKEGIDITITWFKKSFCKKTFI